MTSIEEAKRATRCVACLDVATRNNILKEVADGLEAGAEAILEANALDLSRMDPADSRYDRLKLTRERIAGIAGDMRHVAGLPDPLVELESRTLPNGLQLRKQAVPFGVIGVIYEARPNVTADVFALCFKSGNAVVLKGGRDAGDSSRAIVNVIHGVLGRHGVDAAACMLLEPTHEAADVLVSARGMVDLIIPRGSRRLIDAVRAKATVPVIETGAGVCHCYVDKYADPKIARDCVNNSKTRRVSVCNALDCLLINRDRVGDLPAICAPLQDSNVDIYADAVAYESLKGHYPDALLHHADAGDFGREFLDYKMSVHVVRDVEQAVDHINRYGSGHSESIITDDKTVARSFTTGVDAACVYVNAPTSFTDGAQFGLGAEIGISTQKLHARGPMALREICTYKWIVTGNGQTRP